MYAPTAFALTHPTHRCVLHPIVTQEDTGTMHTFEDCVAFLTSLGVEFFQEYEYRGDVGPGRKSYDLPVFKRVLLPFTSEEWCSLCMSEGDHYVGGCCGSMSLVQDQLNGFFREGGYVSCDDLANIAESMVMHDGGDEDEDCEYPFGTLGEDGPTLDQIVERARDEWETIGPWGKMAVIWQCVKNFYSPSQPRARRKDAPEVDKAISVVANAVHYLYLSNIYTSSPDDADSSNQAHASSLITLARLLPALKTIFDRIDELNPGPIEGFALIDKTQGPDEIASNRRGYCIFETKEQADKLLVLWRQQREHYKETETVPIEEHYAIRPVRVTLQKGIEFLD